MALKHRQKGTAPLSDMFSVLMLENFGTQVCSAAGAV